MRLMLGTANWGRDYGVAGQPGGVDRVSAGEVWEAFTAAGENALDTAAAYGSEALVGETCRGDDALIVTKLDPAAVASEAHGQSGVIRESLLASLERLGVDRIHAVLVHDTAVLAGSGGDRVAASLMNLRAENLVTRVGVSIYTPNELELLPPGFPLGFVQLPLSVLDQRFAVAGLIRSLREQDVEVATRSVFLQGALMGVRPGIRPPPGLAMAVSRVREYASRVGLEPGELAVRFVAACEPDYLVIGANTVEQLRQVIAWSRSSRELGPGVASLAVDDPEVFDPRRWTWAR